MNEFPHPFSREQLIGLVHRIDGNSVSITLPYSASLPQSYFGQRTDGGLVGQFVLIDIGGTALFGRLLEVFTPTPEHSKLTLDEARFEVQANGHVQLLATLGMDGVFSRGLKRHPKVGDAVYAASRPALQAVVTGVAKSDAGTREPYISLGHLSSGADIPVDIAASKLFGRHLAVLGATGSGKSWTLARLMEQVAERSGRLLLIDATGEYSSLEDIAKHVTLGSKMGEPEGVLQASLPHHEFGESDRHAFLRPSGGTQLPKLRSAIRSLRLAQILGAGSGLVDEAGNINKSGRERKPFVEADRLHASAIDNPYAPFSLKALPRQITLECIYDTDLNNPSNFGRYVPNDVAYCNSLISRVMDMLQTEAVTEVINPPVDMPSIFDIIDAWLEDPSSPAILRVSLRNLAFSHFIREICVNTVGRRLLAKSRAGLFLDSPLIVAIDEAHQFFGKTIGDEFTSSSLDAFDSIAKEGRKYGLTVCMATQRPGDIPTGVLSQAGMLLVHRLADKRDQDRVEQAASELDQSALKMLPSLISGEALLVGADFPVPLPVQMTAPRRRPLSSGPDYGKWVIS
jgi:hypothetical protein